MARFILFIVLLFWGGTAISQQLLKGTVRDEQGMPIPYAKIYVKNSAELRTLADIDGYYEMWLYPDEYFLFFSATGYDTRETYVTISEGTVEKDMVLFPTKVQDIEDVQVSAKKSNPGRDIMLKVVRKRDRINPWKYPHTVHGYIKATEKLDRKQEKKKEDEKKKADNESENTDPDGIEDPFAEKRQEDEKLANSMNLVEVDLTRHYGSKYKVKEIRNAFEQRGQKRNNLYYTTTVKSNFNFFQNLLHLDDLHQTPVSSPISGPGILSYKYRLVDQYEENGQKINKIKIIARNTATTTLS